jgi:uncharacterized protein (DUF2249 family)
MPELSSEINQGFDSAGRPCVLLDVSGFEPPEPFKQIVKALASLKAGDALHVVHRREPFPLYQQLPGLGYEYQTVQHIDGLYHIYIWHRSHKDKD